jgi:RNA polymerase-binding transcription factor DksA
MLTDAQRESLRAIMSRRAADLELLIGEERALQQAERYPQNRDDVGDYGDEPVGAELARTEGRLIDLHRAELVELRAAMDRVAAGSYGACTECGDPIDFERLRIHPAARRCGSCQRRHELASGGRRSAR